MSLSSLISFLLEHIYIVIVIVGAIVSIISKSFKNTDGAPGRNRMPDFGGGGPLPRTGTPSRKQPAARPAADQPGTDAAGRREHQPDIRTASSFEEDDDPARSGGREYGAGESEEGRSAEMPETAPGRVAWEAMDDAYADRNESGPKAPSRLAAAMADANPAGYPVPPPAEPTGRESGSPESIDGGEMRRAVLWAEILGPPRAKRPFRR
ncbi:hypothetical protein [Paenibacillus beijingensis]|uniref:hypothetical protein n=1 Tax=Paenibacillus beijingensis TaxID=1126833 RepID=UPI000696DC02|nr:hypothetical protein [Paenibacillus beijingensis]